MASEKCAYCGQIMREVSELCPKRKAEDRCVAKDSVEVSVVYQLTATHHAIRHSPMTSTYQPTVYTITRNEIVVETTHDAFHALQVFINYTQGHL